MAVQWKALRVRAGMSLEGAGARAGVTSATARIFELDPEAIRDPRKRAALIRVYEAFAAAPSPSEADERDDSGGIGALPAALIGRAAR